MFGLGVFLSFGFLKCAKSAKSIVCTFQPKQLTESCNSLALKPSITPSDNFSSLLRKTKDRFLVHYTLPPAHALFNSTKGVQFKYTLGLDARTDVCPFFARDTTLLVKQNSFLVLHCGAGNITLL